MSKIRELLLELLPACIAEDLARHEDDIPFIALQAKRYLEGDPDTRADILAFHESDGVERTRQAHEKIDNGIPTSGDLEDWLKEGEEK